MFTEPFKLDNKIAVEKQSFFIHYFETHIGGAAGAPKRIGMPGSTTCYTAFLGASPRLAMDALSPTVAFPSTPETWRETVTASTAGEDVLEVSEKQIAAA